MADKLLARNARNQNAIILRAYFPQDCLDALELPHNSGAEEEEEEKGEGLMLVYYPSVPMQSMRHSTQRNTLTEQHTAHVLLKGEDNVVSEQAMTYESS